MMLCEAAITNPVAPPVWLAVDHDADLGVVAVDRRRRVGNGRDQRGVADRNSAHRDGLDQDARADPPVRSLAATRLGIASIRVSLPETRWPSMPGVGSVTETLSAQAVPRMQPGPAAPASGVAE